METKAARLARDLAARLDELDDLGAQVAAAHLDAALVALRRQFHIEQDASITD